eukprot:CAMPEP_0184706988 /NCGR_PEP_ID=MMETSP0313-20130426/37042_1 /TAXON_ID=2792 /ORGANISM="Porphyridium aerugineum, Strain SAG 1380-2" /LENGTH=65 /DNA_ID=CAMNT_0027168559 /DNA_START=754 /DNA_END=951 /DNA_ORIENTATION=+
MADKYDKTMGDKMHEASNSAKKMVGEMKGNGPWWGPKYYYAPWIAAAAVAYWYWSTSDNEKNKKH